LLTWGLVTVSLFTSEQNYGMQIKIQHALINPMACSKKKKSATKSYAVQPVLKLFWSPVCVLSDPSMISKWEN